jgi:hypothetical protein
MNGFGVAPITYSIYNLSRSTRSAAVRFLPTSSKHSETTLSLFHRHQITLNNHLRAIHCSEAPKARAKDKGDPAMRCTAHGVYGRSQYLPKILLPHIVERELKALIITIQ